MLDQWLPEYDVRTRHERMVPCPPEQAVAAVLAAPVAPDAVAAALLRLRGLRAGDLTIAGFMRATGFELLAETPTLLVAGMSGTRRRGRIVVFGVAGFALLVICFALSRNVLLSAGVIFLLGLVVALYGTLNDTLLQTLVDDDYRGRVLAVYSMFWGLTPIGSLEAGFLANHVGVQTALAINGALVLCYAPILWRLTPIPRIE